MDEGLKSVPKLLLNQWALLIIKFSAHYTGSGIWIRYCSAIKNWPCNSDNYTRARLLKIAYDHFEFWFWPIDLVKHYYAIVYSESCTVDSFFFHKLSILSCLAVNTIWGFYLHARVILHMVCDELIIRSGQWDSPIFTLANRKCLQ